MVALSLWGLALPMDERIDPATARAGLTALSLTVTTTDVLDPARRESFQFDVGDGHLTILTETRGMLDELSTCSVYKPPAAAAAT